MIYALDEGTTGLKMVLTPAAQSILNTVIRNSC